MIKTQKKKKIAKLLLFTMICKSICDSWTDPSLKVCIGISWDIDDDIVYNVYANHDVSHNLKLNNIHKTNVLHFTLEKLWNKLDKNSSTIVKLVSVNIEKLTADDIKQIQISLKVKILTE